MSIELKNSFTVPVPPAQAWDVLLDVERIATFMPGATVDGVDGDVVTGRIKVMVGAMSLSYRGTANFAERDPQAHTMVVEASGKEIRGAGTASATVRASLEPEPSTGTRVTLNTTMNVTGRPAQFGRGVMEEISGRLIGIFADNLAREITGENTAAAQSLPA
jgi:carbon monoxide dehydrogenase subunit G